MFCLKNIIKYLVYAVVIYALLNFVPNMNLTLPDMIIITIISIMSIILMDHIMNSNTEKFQQENKSISKFPSTDLNYMQPYGQGDAKNYTWGHKNSFLYLDTKNWQLPEKRPPVCKTENPVLVQPLSRGTDLLQWEYAGRVTPPYSIDTDYINSQFKQ